MMRRGFVDKQPYIFVSYSHRDKVTVEQYIEELRLNSYNVWYDDNIVAGDKWDERLREKITNSAYVLVFISEASTLSEAVRKEMDCANEAGKQILPVQVDTVEKTTLADFEKSMGHIQMMNALEISVSDGINGIAEKLGSVAVIRDELFSFEYKQENTKEMEKLRPERIIFLNDKEKTKDIKEIVPINGGGGRNYKVKFTTGDKEYTYGAEKVEIFINPVHIDLNQNNVFVKEKKQNLTGLYKYISEQKETCYYLMFPDCNYNRALKEHEIKLERSVLSEPSVNNIYEYLRELSGLNELKNEKGDQILVNRYKKIDFVSPNTALSAYLKGSEVGDISNESMIPIYPFGCNESQYQAVRNALNSQISVIEGPPGTGKTQTILNIIANILLQNKTVLVVSNNNSATQNVAEKLANDDYGMDFLVASLGKQDNQAEFIDSQSDYPEYIKTWRMKDDFVETLTRISKMSEDIQNLFKNQKERAVLKQELASIESESRVFIQYHERSLKIEQDLRIRNNDSINLLKFIFDCKNIDGSDKLGLFVKLKGFIVHGISWKFLKNRIIDIIDALQIRYYKVRKDELKKRIEYLDETINRIKDLHNQITELSLGVLKDNLYQRYGVKDTRRQRFTSDDIWKNGGAIAEEYPIVLSTTFSSNTSLKDVVFDYVIMDEASQVDIATGAMALSCAKNAVIVGDTKQLPNIVENEKAVMELFSNYNIDRGYIGTNSFLASVKEVLLNVPSQLLQEHYRCHPKIINFCNDKFYDGQLVIMSEDRGENDVLRVIKTVEGQHARGNYNQRQIDEIKELLLTLDDKHGAIGIITPYRKQVEAIHSQIKDIEADTVHKFQGREKDTIIMSMVDDTIKQFSDQPDLMNVAVSRAKHHLYIVTSGNIQSGNSNLEELIKYVQYNNGIVEKGKIRSVFDYLYKQYYADKEEYLKATKKISEYDSENIMYALINDVLSEHYDGLRVLFRYPMYQLVEDLDGLDDRERVYISNPATHVDFLIYSNVSKSPILVIEVDGVTYHKPDSNQGKRDVIKNHILDILGLPYIRFATNGSREKEKLIEKLDELIA